jgi:hypothetical protein
MLFSEMTQEVKVLYESINSSTAPGFTNSGWQILLNVAQRKLIWDILNKGLTKDAFTMRMLEPITVFDEDTTLITTVEYFLNSNNTSAFGATLDTSIFWILDEYLIATGQTRIPLKRITYDFYQDNLRNPYKKPGTDVDSKFWVISSASHGSYNTIIITDGTTLTDPIYKVIGVYHPDENEISIADVYTNGCSKLLKAAHPLIVERAVGLAHLAVTDPEGYQLQVMDNQLQRNY